MALPRNNWRLASRNLVLWLCSLLLANACLVNPVPTPSSAGGSTASDEFADAAKNDVYSPPKNSDAAALTDTGERYGGSADATAADVSAAADTGTADDAGPDAADLSSGNTSDTSDAADLPPDATVQTD